MKAKLTGKISSIFESIDDDGSVDVEFLADGNVNDVVLTAKSTKMHGTFTIKKLVGKDIKFGSKLTITISDEESE